MSPAERTLAIRNGVEKLRFHLYLSNLLSVEGHPEELSKYG